MTEAAAPTARCRNWRRGSFMASLGWVRLIRNNQGHPSLVDQNQIILLSNDAITISNDSRRAVERPRPPPSQIARRRYSPSRHSDGKHGESGGGPQHFATCRFK